MPRSSQHRSVSSQLAAVVFAGLSVVIASGCAQKGASNEPDLQPILKQDAPSGSGSTEEIQKRDQESLADLLKGRVSGVIVSLNPDGSLNIRIRGFASFMGGNDPLYVLDGVPIRVEPGGTIGGITPYHIESIRVLKGPPETTIYGVRGSNGVIVIRTKNSG